MIVGWVLIGLFFLLGVCLVIFPAKIASWWIERHRLFTDKIGGFKPVAGYRMYYVLGPNVIRIAGVLLLGGSVYIASMILFR